MGYVENAVKYRLSTGESWRAYCKRNNCSYVVARGLIIKGKSESEIKTILKKRYVKYEKELLSVVADMQQKIKPGIGSSELGKLRDKLFSYNYFDEGSLAKAWERILYGPAVKTNSEIEMWKQIENTDYEASNLGSFRRKSRSQSGTNTVGYFPVKAYRASRRNKKGEPNRFYMQIKIKQPCGKYKYYSAAKLVAELFVANPNGHDRTWMINGDWQDLRASNIRWLSKKELGSLTGYSPINSRGVELLDEAGRVVKTYRSARAAAKELYVSYQTVLDICNKKVKKEPIVNVRFKKEQDKKCMQNTSS